MSGYTCQSCGLALFSDGAVYGPRDCPLCLHCWLALGESMRDDHDLIQRSAALDEMPEPRSRPEVGPMLPLGGV